MDVQGINRQDAQLQGQSRQTIGEISTLADQAPHNSAASRIPTTLLIDRGGREVARLPGAADWDSPAIVQAARRYLHLPNAVEGQQAKKGANQ